VPSFSQKKLELLKKKPFAMQLQFADPGRGIRFANHQPT
jgi:hypothetical protein